jgi:hypothetical protein
MRGGYACFFLHFDIGEPIFPHLLALSLSISKGGALMADESGRPVTPFSFGTLLEIEALIKVQALCVIVRDERKEGH